VRKNALKDAFEEFSNLQDFKLDAPEIYCRHSAGIDKVYMSRLWAKPCEKPVISWYFGATRSGKTHEALEELG